MSAFFKQGKEESFGEGGTAAVVNSKGSFSNSLQNNEKVKGAFDVGSTAKANPAEPTSTILRMRP